MMSDMVQPQTSLEIQNYKCLADLKLETVGRLNLIAGKNNVGKTTLLEAVSIWASFPDPAAIFKIMDRREEPLSELELVQCFLKYFCGEACKISLFQHSISISPPGQSLPAAGTDDPPWQDFRGANNSRNAEFFSISSSRTSATYELTLDTKTSAYVGRFSQPYPSVHIPHLPCRMINGVELDPTTLRSLWDSTSALPAEDTLIELLQILDPKIRKVTLATSGGKASPKVRLLNDDELSPISRFGDGLSRLFNLGLVLVNCKGGLLLVDEIENGLHHSLFPKLWKFLFEACRRLNITLFATTHSHDAAVSFSRAVAADTDALGILTRLEQRKSGIVAVQFTEQEAYIAAEEGLEVR